MRQLSIPTQIFLSLLTVTALVWLGRGLTVFAFLPGGILWILLLLTIGSGVFTSLQRMR